jgi:hypothetical protein
VRVAQVETARAAPEVVTVTHRSVWLAACAGLVGFIGLIALFYFEGVHAYPGNADRATIVLQGQAMAQGHLLLHGWTLPVDSFWTLDSVLFALLTPLFGATATNMYVGPAVFVALLVLVGVITVNEGSGPGSRASTLAGAGVVVVLLALPAHFLAYFLFGQGVHIGTTLFAVLAFVCLKRSRFGLSWVVAVVLLAIGFLGDPLMIAYGIVPLLLAGAVAMARTRSWRGGLPQISAAAAGIVAGEVTRRIVVAAGGYVSGATIPIASAHQMVRNVGSVFLYAAELTGVTSRHRGTGGVPQPLAALHALGALLIAACVLATLARLVAGAIRGPDRSDRPRSGEPDAWWRLDDMLVIGTLGPAATYVGLALDSSVQTARYLVPSVILASLLSGRVVARLWPRLHATAARRPVAIVAVVIALCFCAGAGLMVDQTQPAQPSRALSAWLESHDLHNGIGDYWAASLTTVESGGQVVVRPVQFDQSSNTMVAYPTNSAAGWYAEQRFDFLVYDLTYWGGVDLGSATSAFGQPEHTYTVAGYVVLVWRKPFMVSTSSSG